MAMEAAVSRSLFLLVFAACDGVTTGDLLWANEGQVCIGPVPDTTSATASPSTTGSTTTAPEPVVLSAGEPVQLEVTFGGCDCGEAFTTASCTATREGDRWTVSSDARSPADGCEPCVPVVATCEVGVLDPGSHSFEHGGELLIVTVPGTVNEPCVGDVTEGTPE